MNGIETTALLPTGGGKTVIYVVAALLRKGITIVIEPLKSLMEGQVKSLQSKNVVAFFINDYLRESQVDQIISFLIDPTHKYAILFTSPEKLVGEKLMHMTRTLIAQKRLSFVAVDEGHCIHLWGESFRESYSKLGVIKTFSVPIVILCESASEKTLNLINEVVGLENPVIIRSSFARGNLTIHVTDKMARPVQQIINIVSNNYRGKCGIIYCLRRDTTKDIAYALKMKGYSTTYTHGGITDHARSKNENLWRLGTVYIMVATKCFGMGIDKPDVSFVIQESLPESPEDYLRQIERG